MGAPFNVGSAPISSSYSFTNPSGLTWKLIRSLSQICWNRHPFFKAFLAHEYSCVCVCVCVVFLYCIQSGNDLQEDLAKFGYKLNMKINSLNSYPSIFLATLLETMNRNLEIFLKFWLSSGYWKSQKANDLALFF